MALLTQREKKEKHFPHPSSFFLWSSSVCLMSLCCNSCQIPSASYVLFERSERRYWNALDLVRHLFESRRCITLHLSMMTELCFFKKKVWHLSNFHPRSVSAFHHRCTSVTSERADHDVSRPAALLSIRSHRVGRRAGGFISRLRPLQPWGSAPAAISAVGVLSH